MSETSKERRKRLQHECQQRYRENKKRKMTAETNRLTQPENIASFSNEITNNLPSFLTSNISMNLKAEVSTHVNPPINTSLIPVRVSTHVRVPLLKARVYSWSSQELNCHSLGNMDRRCSNCKISLPPLQELPFPLNALLTRMDLSARLFRQNIRMYNSALAFTSMGAKIDGNITGTAGIYSFRIYDEMYHNIDLKIIITDSRMKDPRRYNTPSAAEVAIIMIGNEQEPEPLQRDIVLHLREGRFQQISELHHAYEPLHYVLMFPRGDDGWHPYIPLKHSTLSASTIQEPIVDDNFLHSLGEQVYNNQTHEWKPRQCGNVIGRMYFIHPLSGERYYLRLLLTIVRGATSFSHLRTDYCLAEAAQIHTGSQLCYLFATILLFCAPSILQQHGKSLANFPNMPISATFDQPNSLITEELNYNTEELSHIVETKVPQLNED
ncbi:20041_t:CDS:2 [Cetraspora pellucida]|uniref:20041_t:CDS:1 n=1 Tax=Cetraspora pellucida TaxID=1433469 RepID=A0A9N9GG42_9GLOM|nr:20041_t:CDS:2 [Cetraspora pellucida]